MNQAFLIKLVDGFRAQSINIHRFATHEMLYLALDLRRTSRIIGAIMRRFALIACQRATTFRTFVDETDLIAYHETGIHIHTYNLRDDFTALFYIHHITNVQVEPFNDIGIVQGSTLHHRTGQLDRIEIGHWRNGTGASYLISHHIQSGACPFCLELIGYGPTGRLGRIPQIALLTEGIDLQNDTIRCHRKVLPFHIPIANKLQHFFQCSTFPHDIADLKAPSGSRLHILVMAVARQILTQ